MEQDSEETVRMYRDAAEKGDAEAQNSLGLCYANGSGVKRDYKTAAVWFSRAADQGYADAQRNFGWCYANGKGVEQNTFVAAMWYNEADRCKRLLSENTGVR